MRYTERELSISEIKCTTNKQPIQFIYDNEMGCYILNEGLLVAISNTLNNIYEFLTFM